jgi:hypothetical protein
MHVIRSIIPFFQRAIPSWGYVAWTDINMAFEFENNYMDIPVGLRFGSVFQAELAQELTLETKWVFIPGL